MSGVLGLSVNVFSLKQREQSTVTVLFIIILIKKFCNIDSRVLKKNIQLKKNLSINFTETNTLSVTLQTLYKIPRENN